MRIKEVLRKKGVDVVTLPAAASVRELVAVMRDHNVGALVVSRDGSAIDGIVSERDVVRALADDEKVLDRRIEDIMTRDVTTCLPEDTLEDLARAMTNQRIRHVPVAVSATLVGIVSIGDVVKNRIDELEFERQQLEGYITRSGA